MSGLRGSPGAPPSHRLRSHDHQPRLAFEASCESVTDLPSGRESLRDSTVSRGGEVPPAQHCRFHRFCCCLALSRATRMKRCGVWTMSSRAVLSGPRLSRWCARCREPLRSTCARRERGEASFGASATLRCGPGGVCQREGPKRPAGIKPAGIKPSLKSF